MKVTVAAAVLGACAAFAAQAGEPQGGSRGGTSGAAVAVSPVVIELFTSQGCSSCPPADALAAQLAHRGDVLVLSYHVDYWNYLGWRDTFSNEGATQRQKAYAKAMGQRMVYTPQIVVNGVKAVVGSDAGAVEAAITAAAGADPSIAALTLRAEAGEALATASMADSAPGVVVLVVYGASAEVSVERGENAGRDLATTNPVIEWTTLGPVDAEQRSWRAHLPDGAQGVAALLHGRNGAIVASAAVATPGR
ncbi:DUF1223 domain-containing protein [Rubrimonas cliftonensis]|uniref:DUF1223 domain-containing protein n=1 Tax=Rubrimonas cliftonensis TaxID=89524 RepID=A0A1H4F7Q0_9RHOB|nr:DUF1223 domain-containing protein [Rubrimonas cliftonensis]SEA92950.1 hypothetical protein SAMN05444370_1196 [Rubrimonas cliftonensis]